MKPGFYEYSGKVHTTRTLLVTLLLFSPVMAGLGWAMSFFWETLPGTPLFIGLCWIGGSLLFKGLPRLITFCQIRSIGWLTGILFVVSAAFSGGFWAGYLMNASSNIALWRVGLLFGLTLFALLVLFADYVISMNILPRPFCEQCLSFFPTPQHGSFSTVQPEKLHASLDRGEFQEFSELLQSEADLERVEIELFSCPNCPTQPSYSAIVHERMEEQELQQHGFWKMELDHAERTSLATKLEAVRKKAFIDFPLDAPSYSLTQGNLIAENGVLIGRISLGQESRAWSYLFGTIGGLCLFLGLLTLGLFWPMVPPDDGTVTSTSPQLVLTLGIGLTLFGIAGVYGAYRLLQFPSIQFGPPSVPVQLTWSIKKQAWDVVSGEHKLGSIQRKFGNRLLFYDVSEKLLAHTLAPNDSSITLQDRTGEPIGEFESDRSWHEGACTIWVRLKQGSSLTMQLAVAGACCLGYLRRKGDSRSPFDRFGAVQYGRGASSRE